MLAWILNTNPLNAGSVGDTSRTVASRSRGLGAHSTKAFKISRTPKLLIAEPKKTGVCVFYQTENKTIKFIFDFTKNKLGTSVSGISDVSDVVKSTSDFSSKTKEATTAIGTMATAFSNSASTMASFNNASESAKGFHEQVQVLTKNLGSLNTIYELELKESNNHLKALNSFYGKMAEASSAMMNSVDDANKAKEQIGLLAGNLGKLNSVYGNMLSAMQVKN